MTRSPRRLKEQVRDTVSELPIQAARFAVMGVGRALLLTDRVRKDYREARQSGLGPVLGRLKDDAENITGMVVGKVSGNGKTAEEPERRTSGESEISVGKPRRAAASRPAAPARPATSPPARPKPTSGKPTTGKPTTGKPTTGRQAAGKPAAAEGAGPKPATSRPATAKPATPKPAAQKPATKPAAKPAAKPATATPTTAKAKPAESKPATAPKADAKPKTATAEQPSTAKPAAKPKTAESKPPAGKDLPLAAYDGATLASVRARLRSLDTRQVTELRDYERAHAARADFLRMYENRIAKLRGDH
jgi:hypothetical protein